MFIRSEEHINKSLPSKTKLSLPLLYRCQVASKFGCTFNNMAQAPCIGIYILNAYSRALKAPNQLIRWLFEF